MDLKIALTCLIILLLVRAFGTAFLFAGERAKIFVGGFIIGDFLVGVIAFLSFIWRVL